MTKKKSPVNIDNAELTGERRSPKKTRAAMRAAMKRAEEAAKAAADQRDEDADQRLSESDHDDEPPSPKPKKKKKKVTEDAEAAGAELSPELTAMLASLIRKSIGDEILPMIGAFKAEVADMLAGAEPSPPSAAAAVGAKVSPILAATAASAPSTALEFHTKIYKVVSMLASQASDSLATDPEKARFSLAALLAFAKVAVQAAENLGPQQGCGLNTMVKYISSMAMSCLEDPATAVYNKSAAEAMLATARSEAANRSPGKRKGNRQGNGNRPQAAADRDDKRRDDRRDDGRDRYPRRN